MIRTRLNKFLLLLKRAGFYVPVTIYALLFGIAVLAGYAWLQRLTSIPDSSYKDVFKLLLSLALLIGSCILCLGMVSVCFAFLFFSWKYSKGESVIRVSNVSKGDENEKQLVSVYVHPVLRPLLGYLRIRLSYDQVRYSKKLNLVDQNQGKLIRKSLEGTYSWDLPEIREYRIESILLYFEDFFQFFSFAKRLPASDSFYTPPRTQAVESISASPRKTEEQTTRIEELKKVEGEYINYKNFENSDDVRRIVWKIYAKNKELVVRIPEILDPYASHIYLYASFFSVFNTQGNELLEVPLLNYYKTICWSVYQQFVKKGVEVRYVPDQFIPQQLLEEGDSTRYKITLSSWQQEKDLKAYVDPRDAAIVLLSSLSDPEQVKEMIARYGASISFVLVPLTEVFGHQNFAHWLQWLFVQQEKDKTAVYKSSWNLSTLRLRIEQNEKTLSVLLKDHQKVIA